MSLSQSSRSTQDAEAASSPSRKWGLLGYAIVFACIAAAAFFGKQGLSAVKSYRARSLTAEAEAAVKKQLWESAGSALNKAMAIAPDDPVVLRKTAEFLSKSGGDPQIILTFQKKLQATGKAQPADFIRQAETLLILGEVVKAKQIYDELPEPARQKREGMELLAKLLNEQEQQAEAMAVLRNALLSEPNDPECRLRLAMLDLDQPFDETRLTAHQTIWQIARQKDSTALQAILFLAASKDLKPGESDQLLKTLAEHPDAQDRHRFAVLSSHIRLFPNRRNEVLDREAERFKGAGIETMAPFLRWLGSEGQHARILQMAPVNVVVKSADVFPVFAEAMLADGRHAELRAMIESRNPPSVSEALGRALLAECYAVLEKNLVQARHHLASSFAAAEKIGDYGTVLRAARIAETKGIWEIAAQGYEILASRNPRTRLAMLAKVFEMESLRKDGPAMISTAKRIAALRPDSASFRSRVDYLSLVLGHGFEPALDSAFQPAAGATAPQSPEAASFAALVRSLAAYRMGDFARMKDSLSAVQTPQRLPPGPRAVFAGLSALSGSGDTEPFKIAETIPPSLLLEEESRFLARALRP